MAKTPDPRPWREIGTLDRVVRAAMAIGGASFAAFWAISVWLEGAAWQQPHAATGIYQFAYYHKGHTNYITARQASLAHWGSILAYGWALFAVAGCWAVLSETRAAQIRTDKFLGHQHPGGENFDT